MEADTTSSSGPGGLQSTDDLRHSSDDANGGQTLRVHIDQVIPFYSLLTTNPPTELRHITSQRNGTWLSDRRQTTRKVQQQADLNSDNVDTTAVDILVTYLRW